MTDAAKLSKLKIQLNITGTSLDDKLNDYLDSAKREIINWIYVNYPDEIEDVTAVPTKYEMVQIQAVVVGYNLEGAENESAHNENGISHTFDYTSMIAYIHDHVYQLV